MKVLNKIPFTKGTLLKEGEYYTLELFTAGGLRIYTATLDSNTAARTINKHNNITLLKQAK